MLNSLFSHFDSIIVLDTETTGLDYRTDEIIELAALKVSVKDGDVSSQELDLLVRLSDGKTLPRNITQLTGISEEMLLQNGASKADVCEQFSDMIMESKTLLAAYNAQFDLCFLYSFLAKFGASSLLKQLKFLDALTIYKDRREYPHKLSDAVSAYSLKTQNTHRAIDDVKASFELLQAMEKESADLDRYINLFGYNPKYGVSGQKISSITYVAQSYYEKDKLYKKIHV